MAKNKDSRNQERSQGNDDDRDDKIVLEGIVDEALPGTLFKIKTTAGHVVLATLSGKLRQNKIRLLVGDRVQCEVSPYDLTRGRVSWRIS